MIVPTRIPENLAPVESMDSNVRARGAVLLESRELNALAFTFAGLLCLLLSLVLYDIVTHRRLHPATAWGVTGYLAWFLVCIFAIPGTALGRMTAEWLVRIAAE
jgi:hypothetical protein